MSFAFPLGLLAAALAGPLILLYVLKLRRREVVVSSTLPWRRVLADRRANAPWERLRRHLLLLLQLLALLLLVLGFAGPFRRAETTLSGDTVVVLDVSASMGAKRPDGRTRMDEARARIREALHSVEGGRRAALVLAGPQPIVASPLVAERAALQRALQGALVTEAPADLSAALQLASSLARGGAGGEILLVTDGAFDRTPALEIALKPARVLTVGGDEPVSNAGITSLALRPVAGEAGVHELFVGVHAHAAGAEPLPIVVESAQPGELEPGAPAPDAAAWEWTEVARESVLPGDAASASQLVRVSALAGSALRVRLGRTDALAADDAALLIVPERPARRVLLVSEHPFLLQRALAAAGTVEVSLVSEVPATGSDADVIVVDGPLPAVLPDRPLLAFGAPRSASGTIEEPRILRWQSRHPALRHARFDAVRVASAWAGELPPGGEVLVESDQGPLAVSWPAPGGRALAFWFDVTETDLPLRVTFPVVVMDALDWLTEGRESDGVVATGRGLEVALPGIDRVALLLPGGGRRDAEVRGGMLEVPPLLASGPFVIAPEGGAPRLLSSALLSPEETDLAARGTAGLEASGTSAEAAAVQVPGRKHLWPLAAALALGVLLSEWAVYHRRRE